MYRFRKSELLHHDLESVEALRFRSLHLCAELLD